MSARLWSAPGIFMVAVHEDIVVLDVSADRYECLLEAAAWLKPIDNGSLGVPDEATAGQLIEAGLASNQPLQGARPSIPPASRQLPPIASSSRSDLVRAGLVLAAATAAFRYLPLAGLIAPAAGPVRPSHHLDEARLAALVGEARAAAPYVPFEGECLQRAYQLRRLLYREGYSPQWIFGVRTWPFGAHCWLQIGDLVVGDTLDRVRFYTPIMAA